MTPIESPSLGSTEPTYAPDDPRSFVEAIFTAPADPLTVVPTIETASAVTVEIEPSGGSISTTAADGTEYMLTIPQDAFAFAESITMTPITELVGLPTEAGTLRVFGVNLLPEGLQLAASATLIIKPATPLPDNLVALEHRGAGAETGFHYFERTDGSVTMRLDHFSTYDVTSFLDVGAWSPTLLRKLFTQTDIEARFRSEVATKLANIRWTQLTSIGEPMTVIEVARAVLPLYKRLILGPRVAIADRGCTEANAAMEAYLEYQQQRQLLGVGDDPEFDLVGAGLFVPQALVDLAVEVCFKDAYQRCARFGDFRTLAGYFLTFFQRVLIIGAEPASEHVALAQEYLRRCGRWRVKIATTTITTKKTDSGLEEDLQWESSREFYVQWKASDGRYGIVGSTIDGSGPVEGTKITESHYACDVAISGIHSTQDARATIRSLRFGYPEGPTLTGDPLAPEPLSLTLVVGLGQLAYQRSGCSLDDEAQSPALFSYQLAASESGETTTTEELYGQVEAGTAAATFVKGWEFRREPFKATLVQSDEDSNEYPHGTITYGARNEVTVEHEPQ